MARRPPPLPVSSPQTRAENRYPDLPPIDGIHDARTCPTCAPIVTSPAYARGVAAAKANAKEHTSP